MRKKQKYKREIEQDYLYNNPVVAKFINIVMKAGKKTIAEKVVYGALENIKETTKKDPWSFLIRRSEIFLRSWS